LVEGDIFKYNTYQEFCGGLKYNKDHASKGVKQCWAV
jgi:hypothetical protein